MAGELAGVRFVPTTTEPDPAAVARVVQYAGKAAARFLVDAQGT